MQRLTLHMWKTWFDRLSYLALAIAIALVAYSAASNHLRDQRLARLEEHRTALDAYAKTVEEWEKEKAAEAAARAATARWQSEVMDRLDAIERCSCGVDP